MKSIDLHDNVTRGPSGSSWRAHRSRVLKWLACWIVSPISVNEIRFEGIFTEVHGLFFVDV
jgi:hypothetical protein